MGRGEVVQQDAGGCSWNPNRILDYNQHAVQSPLFEKWKVWGNIQSTGEGGGRSQFPGKSLRDTVAIRDREVRSCLIYKQYSWS